MPKRNLRRSVEVNRELTQFVGNTVSALQTQAQRTQYLESVSPGRQRLSVLSSALVISQTAAETEYASVILPRGLLESTNIMSIFSELWLYNVSAANNNITFKVKYGTDIHTIGPIVFTPLATQALYRVCRLKTLIIGNGLPTAQRVNTSLTVSGIINVIATTNTIEAEIGSTMAVNSQEDQFLQLTVQHSDSTVLFRTVRNLVEFGFPIPAS